MRVPAFLAFFLLTQAAMAIMPKDVSIEVAKFKPAHGPLPKEYTDSIPSIIQKLIYAEETKDYKSQADCIDKYSVSFVDHFTESTNPSIHEFESNFIRVEASKCLRNTNSDKVIDVFSSVKFKETAYKTVYGLKPLGDGKFCEKSKTTGVGESSYCYLNEIDKVDAKYVLMDSINYWNESVLPYKAEIFFRETLVSARQIQNDVQVHTITYVRGRNIGSLDRFLIENFSKSTQTQVFSSLAEQLK